MRKCVTHHHACDCREELFRQIREKGERLEAEKDANERWMSQAHAMCFDLGITPGHIEDRMFEAIGRVNVLRAIADAAQNLCKAKGRHHSEIAMRKLIEASGMMGPNVKSAAHKMENFPSRRRIESLRD